MLELNISNLLLFDTVLTTLSRYRGKKGVDLRSIAELRAFYGTIYDFQLCCDFASQIPTLITESQKFRPLQLESLVTVFFLRYRLVPVKKYKNSLTLHGSLVLKYRRTAR